MGFCSEKQVDPLQTSVEIVLEFLTWLFPKIGYSALNTARAALSSFVILTDGHTLSSHPLVTRFMKGVFNLKPPTARYSTTWDVKPVLDYLRNLPSISNISLQDLSLKTCMLVALVTAQRQQTLHLLDITRMTIKDRTVEFQVTDALKQTRPGWTGCKIVMERYDADPRLCVYDHIKEYLHRTQSLRKDERYLFVSYRKPHNRVSRDTMARWIKQVMRKAGIDVGIFRPHSTRAAAVSKASQAMLPVVDIMRHVGWSSEKTFQTYYNKPLQGQNLFAAAVFQD